MKKKILLICLLLMTLLFSSFSFNATADVNYCAGVYKNSYPCVSFNNKTLEWDDDNIYNCIINNMRLYTFYTWTVGGTWDLSQTWLFINNESCGNPTFVTGTNKYLYWDNLAIEVSGTNVTFEIYFGKTGSGCGTIAISNGLGYNDVDCDGDHVWYRNSGNTSNNGVFDQNNPDSIADPSYFFNYTDTSAGANITTIGSSVTENTANLQGYFYNGTETPADHFLLGFNVSSNPDMSSNFSYYWGTTGISQYFTYPVSNLTTGTYYFRAFGQNTSDTSMFIYGNISSFDLNVTTKTFYLKFFDKETGKLLHFKGYNIDSAEMGTLDYCEMYVNSELTPNGLVDSKSDSTGKVAVTGAFVEGDYITFEMIGEYYNFYVRINNIGYSFKPVDVLKQVYAGQTYNIFLYPYDYDDGNDYPYDGGHDYTNGQVSLHLTKRTYDYGDTFRCRYKLPTASWLHSHDWDVNGWWIVTFNTDEYFWGVNWNINNWITYQPLSANSFDGDYHTWEHTITHYNSHGYKTYYEKYEVMIINYYTPVWSNDVMYSGKYFYCSGEDFEPEGNITSISPNPCYMGQPVTFSWTSNGAGRLEICYPNGEIYFSVPYGYESGTHTTTKVISAVGTLPVNLYTESSLINSSQLPVDTDTLVCNPIDENGTYGSFGYGIPYLYIPRYRGIAGYDTIYIYYRTYKNDSLLTVKSPRGETTYFSTTVSNESDNVLAIYLQNYMQIGSWNVTLEGGDIYGNNITLNSSFNVVNEEGNWIEFSKHVFVENEPFEIYIKHSYRVSLTFYKNNVAEGENIIFQVGEQDNAKYIIPTNKVKPSAGNWRVEMWRINDRNQVYELAEWECRVVKAPYVAPDTGLSVSIASIPMFIRVIVGFGITLVCTIIPLIIAMYLGKHRISINIPSLVYVAFFFLGLIVATVFGFLPIWVIFVIMFGIIITFAVTWYFGQKENKVESQE